MTAGTHTRTTAEPHAPMASHPPMAADPRTPQDPVRALLYHATRLREIARALDGDEHGPAAAAPGTGPAVPEDGGAAVRRLVPWVRRRSVRARISLSPLMADGRPPAVEALHAALLDGPGPLRLVVPRALLADEEGRGLLKRCTAAGADVRAASLGLPEAVVIDGTVAVLCAPGARGAPAVVRDRILVHSLETLIDAVWAQSPDAGWLAELGTDALREAEEGGGTLPRVLELLGTGWTDEAAARELGCSVRTYRRHVADLMRMLRARSRFQAGLRAAQGRLAVP
ncbi:helix-turn-helix transcriptional regulator [Streptomyces sp. NPDC003077]|uniref:helix-turn-helix transcriptional regulator n=1 Tax=Streptomyces sp. NPDC003077 TaxID=3154443 RepID=UPI0033A8DDE1